VNLDWVPAEHKEKVDALLPILIEACEAAEKSKRFLDLQLNPKAAWKGWPAEVAEEWLNKRPKVLFDYFAGDTTPAKVGAALKARLHDVYRPQTGNKIGRPAREPVPGLVVAPEVDALLNDVTWDAMAKSGAITDAEGMRATLKLPSIRDEDGDDSDVVIASAGTVKGAAFAARYTSLRGDLYWSDVRNVLELWVRARPELLAEYEAWAAAGKPRAWEPGGEWIPAPGGGRKEHNPLVHIRASAWKAAQKAISMWRADGTVSLDAIIQAAGEEGLDSAKRPAAERVQHKPKTGHTHYAWGLRDRADCYHFPVETRPLGRVSL
jgi:hypothetical protein